MDEHSNTDLAYAAAMVDGEGYVGITMQRQGKYKRGYGLRVMVQVNMTDYEIPCWLYSNFGGCLRPSKSYKAGAKDLWVWNASSQIALRFLLQIRPYLKLKAAQADICIAFQQRRYRGKRISAKQDEIDKLDYLWAKGLNRRGK